MSDEAIRFAVERQIRRRSPPVLLRHELGLMSHAVRADLATLSEEEFSLFEIKSDADNLQRLPGQAFAYSLVGDHCTLVAASRHLPAAIELVPDWWEIWEASAAGDATCLREVRAGKRNPSPDPCSVARLLWGDEMAASLRAIGVNPRGLWLAKKAEILGKHVPLDRLRQIVRAKLSARRKGAGGFGVWDSFS